MSEQDNYEDIGSEKADRHAARRAKKQFKAQEGPVVARYGIWNGEGYLREGTGLEKKLAERSLKVDGQTRREKRRRKKK